MPAMQGILNKSSTNGVSTTEQTQPLRPPKPATRRVIPRFRLPQGFRGLTKWRHRPSLNESKKSEDRDGRVSSAVRFADEEEPKTEDSLEYRDIDFASDIFDFRIPIPSTTQVRKPARPPPPPPSPPTSLSKQATTKTVAFSDIPLIDDEQQPADLDTQEEPECHPTEVEVTISVVDSPEETPETEDAVQTLTPEERLTKFLRDHEGQELSQADVDELEKLLNETDEAEMVDNAETKENNICSAESQTHFEEKEVVDEVNSEIPVPLIVEEVSIQVEPTGHTDFSVMEFNKIESHENVAPKRVKPIDDGIYEPVGEPLPSCERRCLPKPPDMSGFVPPKASTKVGDPFSWRRRGMRRWDRYGYEKFKQDPYIPATMQIVEGCQQVEHWIMSRQLSPPGYLLGVLGTTRKLKRRKKKKKKPVPIINAVHPPQPFEILCKPAESESFEEKIAQIILRETFEELKRNHSLNSEPESSSDVTVVAKEVLVVTSSPPPAIQPEVETLEAKFQTLDKDKIDDVPIKVYVAPVEIKERNVEKVSEVIQGASSPNQTGHVSRKESFLKKERPPRPLPPTPVSVQESKPIRPSRRAKRVSSVDRPSSAAEMAPATEVMSELPFQAQTFPRVKESPKRGVSTEEVQRRIQIQAQQFFRTPRKKELQLLFTSPTTPSSGFSSSLFNTTPRRRPRKSHLPPVYTPINKTCPRKKDFGAQTSEDHEIEDEDDRESIPPPPPPKMHHLLMSTIKSSENLTIGQAENHIRTDDEQHYDNDEILKTAPMESVPSKIEPPVIVEQPIVNKESGTAPNSNVSEAPALSSSSPTYPTYIDSILNPSNLPIFKLGSSDVQVALFYGFLPAGGNLPTNLTELPEMTVHRLNVTHLEAAFIKVGQVEAGQMVIQRVDQLNSSSCPTQGANTSRIDYTKETEHHEPNSSEQQHVEEKILQRESSVVDVNGNDSLMSEKPFNWDENSSWSGRMNPSSSSASYVTCDETIHESLTDSEFSTDIEDEMEREEDEETTTGCSTPTPHEDLDVGQNVDYDLLRQVFAAAVAGSHPNNHDISQLEECAVKENLEQDREGESSGVANGAEENHSSEKEVLHFEEVEHEERVDDKMSSVRRSRSSNSPIMRRTDYRRRAIKRNNSPNLQTDDATPPAAPPRKAHLVPKSQSANIPSSNHPRRFKPISCPPGDAKLSDDDIIDANNAATPCLLAPPPTQQQPLSSDDEASSGSSSEDEDKTENGCSDKKPPKSYFIAKELMTTERTFVDVLKLLHLDLRKDVEQMNNRFGQPVIPDDVYNRIFGCFPQLHALNEVLLHEIEQRIEHWSDTPKISDIIVKHGPFLKIYTSYFKNYSQLIAMLDDACKKYPLFGEVLKDFEMKERCKKLEVKHYMLKPVQRIPQYRLLLTDYLKHIDETSPDYADTQEALNVVSKVAEHANDTMKETEKFAKLLQLQNLFASYQVVKPGRLFVCEGDLYKLCRKGIQSRRFILFSDCLLHCSVVTQGQLRVHHELPLSDMKVQTPKQVESPTEFSVVSVARSFTLAASSIEEREAWLEALNKAIAENECKRKTFLQAKRQNQIGVGVSTRSDERLGQKAPIWVPDSRVTMCQLCMREFTLTFRRHHCRACGKVICSLCSANRAPLFYLNYQPARVCYECYHILQKEIDSQDRLSVNNVKVNSDSEEGKNKEEPLLPSIENLRAQFKQLSPIVGEPKKIYVPKVLQEVSANDTGSTFSGYLNKKVKRGWKRQWFVVKDKVLYSYKASEDVAALESIVLLGFVVKTPKAPLDGISPSLLVELQHKGRDSMIFYADSESVTERWLEAFRQAVVLE